LACRRGSSLSRVDTGCHPCGMAHPLRT
jgi:hypothetical protein